MKEIARGSWGPRAWVLAEGCTFQVQQDYPRGWEIIVPPELRSAITHWGESSLSVLK